VDVSVLKEILMNTGLSLFDRYRAMFALRDIGTEEAVLALATGLDVKRKKKSSFVP
jgi:deoxyhypusine monooxygenase